MLKHNPLHFLPHYLLSKCLQKVLDGHGGQFAADWVKDHLLEVKKETLELVTGLKIVQKKRVGIYNLTEN